MPGSTKSTCLVCLLLMSWQQTAAQSANPSSPPRVLLRAHLANLDTFEKFTCRYTRSYAFAASIEDALACRYTTPSRTAKVLWAKNGRDVSLKVEEDEETARQQQHPDKFDSVLGQPNLRMGPFLPHFSHDYLSSEEGTLMHDGRHRTINVSGNDKFIHETGLFLFGCYDGRDGKNCEDQAVMLLDHLDRGSAEFRTEQVMADTKRLAKLSVDCTRSNGQHGGWVREYIIDPTHGYQFQRWYVLKDGRSKTETKLHVEYPDPRDCGSGRWFPGRVVRLMKQSQMKDWMVYDSRVVELEIDKTPSREHFEIAIPAGTTIMDIENTRNQFRTRKAERIHISDIPTIYQMAQTKQSTPLMDTAISEHRPSYRWALWGGVVAGSVLLIGVVGRVVSRRRAAV